MGYEIFDIATLPHCLLLSSPLAITDFYSYFFVDFFYTSKSAWFVDRLKYLVSEMKIKSRKFTCIFQIFFFFHIFSFNSFEYWMSLNFTLTWFEQTRLVLFHMVQANAKTCFVSFDPSTFKDNWISTVLSFFPFGIFRMLWLTIHHKFGLKCTNL